MGTLGAIIICIVLAFNGLYPCAFDVFSKKSERPRRFLNWQRASPPPHCTSANVTTSRNSSSISYLSSPLRIDALCERDPCPSHSFCFLGSCACHPGYSASSLCSNRTATVAAANPWYTADCPNLALNNANTYKENTPLAQLGGEYHRSDKGAVCKMAPGVPLHYEHKFCAYLCYAHPSYGVAVVPKSLCKPQ